jgi:transposase-like protein
MSPALKTEVNTPGWKPGDEKCRAVYELVAAGTSWSDACRSIGVSYTTAQMKYRVRGLPSPRRTNVEPAGGRDAAAERAYARSLGGEVAAAVSKAEGISYQYLRRWCARNGKTAPNTSLRQVKAEIRSMFGPAA